MTGPVPLATAGLTDLAVATLARPTLMTVTTIDPDGSPQVSLVWQEPGDNTVRFFADAASRKIANLRRDPRVACTVVDDTISLGLGVPCYLTIRGDAEIGDRDDDLVARLTAKYMHCDTYPFGPLDPFVAVTIHPRSLGGNLTDGARRASRGAPRDEAS